MEISYKAADLRTPHGTAIFMMRRGANPDLIVAYLAHEARALGVDPFDLSRHPGDVTSRAMRSLGDAARKAGHRMGAFFAAFSQEADLDGR